LLFPPPHPSITAVCLFVCLFFCFDLLHWDLPNHNNPLPCSCYNWPSAASWFCNVTPMVQELLHVDQFCHSKFNQIKFNSFRAIGSIDAHVGRLLMSRVLWRWFHNF
jgi:hypothetical protein